MVRDEEIEAAVAVLRRGGLVAFPTETVYGLGADATNRAALRRLFVVKGRPVDHPVIVHLAGPADLEAWAATVPPAAQALVDAFWPGPLTVVLRRGAHVLDEVTGGRDTVAVRVPAQPVALRLLRAFGGGIAAPSANRFGRVSPTRASDVRADLGDDVDMILDGGPCTVGVESTIVDCTSEPPVILRLGGVPREAVEGLLDVAVPVLDTGAIAAPGTHAAHYAPRTQVRVLTDAEVLERAGSLLRCGRRVGLLAMSPPENPPEGLVVLEPPADVDDYARVLYRRLREADARALDDLLVVPPPPTGIGAAVADRLRRAAAGSAEPEPGP